MRTILFLGLCFMVIFAGAGCQDSNNRAAEGAIIGGILGAAGGGIIGHQSHHGGEGAAIGAAAGVLTGAVVGGSIQKTPQQGAQSAQSGQPSPNQMSIQQIVDLTKQGVNEAVIIDRIRLTNSKFTLTPADVDSLKQQGVSQNVISVMQGL